MSALIWQVLAGVGVAIGVAILVWLIVWASRASRLPPREVVDGLLEVTLEDVGRQRLQLDLWGHGTTPALLVDLVATKNDDMESRMGERLWKYPKE